MQRNQTRTRSSGARSATAILLAAAAMSAAPAVSWAQVDQFEFFFNSSVSQGGTNAMGGFAYDPVNNAFYTAGFTGASQALRKITFSGGSWTGTVQVGQTDWVNKFMASSSVAGNGVILPASFSSTNTPGDILLNPTSLTIDGVTYAPGTTGILVDQATVRDTSAGNAVQPQYSKIVYAYDLRAIDATPGSNTGRDRNGDTDVDWNDVFTPITTTQDLQTVQSAINGSAVTSTTLNIARRFAFSTDGQSVYFNDAASTFGGIWKVNLTTPGAAGVTKVVQAIGGTRINSEPAVLHTSVRNLGVAGAGDQVLFQGATDIGNLGGISFILDNGTQLQTPQTLLSEKQLKFFYDNPQQTGGDVGSITTDAAGNIYFMQTANNAGVFMYDAQGRLVKVFSNAEQRTFDASQGATTFNVNSLDLKVRDKTINFPGGPAVLPQILYNDASSIRTVIGATVYKPGDFNRDNVVDAADVALFKTKLGLRGVVVASIGTSTPFTQTNTANLKYDLNGSFTSGSGSTAVQGVAIDWKDVKIFQQFAGLSDGDVDMDFDVDATDLSTLAANYNGTGKLFTQGNLTSVRIANTDKDDVNYADLVTLAANWTGAKPAPGALGSIPAADLDRAFAISANGSLHHYVAKGSGTWSSTSEWSGGSIPNSPGAVASFLTKPQDDTVVVVDGSYTVGQLNFDNYFTYSLAGGTLNLNGNGPAAEINAFAASPTINSAVVAQTDTNVTVTYAADTLAINGPLTIAAGQTLTKQGPGALRLTGGGTSAGTLAVASGSGKVTSTAFSTVGGLSLAAGTTLDLANGGITVNNTDATIASSLLASLTSGYAAGNWNGVGINSSAAAADPQDLHSLAYIDHGTSFTILYTLVGDANLSGTIDADDYALADAGLASGASSWIRGDFNYSGSVDSLDIALLDRTAALLNGGVVSPSLLATREAQFGTEYVSSLLASIPEPSSLAACGLAILPLLRRRRSH